MLNTIEYINNLLSSSGATAKVRISRWALASLMFGVISALFFVGTGYGYQWSWWELGTAFTWIMPLSTMLGLMGFSLGFFFGFLKWRNPQKRGVVVALIGFLLGLSVMGTAIYWLNEVQKYPPIHDISTDIEHPPTFEAIVPLRADAPNDTTYGDQEKADIQREHYPDIQPLYLDMGYDDAYARALAAAKRMPWEQVVTSDKSAGRIEAVDKLPWFGFKDDIVIRVDTAKTQNKTKIDIRSVSRIGKGDIGVNAQRIRNYLKSVTNQ
ncbi:Protein of unknown function (DUF1499) [Fodinibius salinus]|uniref:DUF1499 domain-containing protein n=1 Tax=Fodinibius salinus TaxID=860790 RepID=A0A5D3YNU5_9BACT|nr:DUF1499 domain-containing protein [Fodinibius salinus]TYP95362.1 Protein of unknown function (DUF1499) [Fodinibius salinus]